MTRGADEEPDRLLLDEMFSPLVSQVLVHRGIDSVSVGSDSVMKGMPDPSLLQLALDQRRVFVTADVGDFEALLARRRRNGLANPGTIWVSQRSFGTARRFVGPLADALEHAARTHIAGRSGGTSWLPSACRRVSVGPGRGRRVGGRQYAADGGKCPPRLAQFPPTGARRLIGRWK